MRPILILIMALAAGVAAAQQQPSFDCARAQGEAQALICADAGLAAMDRELARLYRLAVDGPRMTPARLKDLRAQQRGWIKGRDDCWKAADVAGCVRFAYASRIHELRRDEADARARDDEGISHGPFALTCDGLDAAVSTSFVNGPDAVAYVAVDEAAHVLTATRVASGAAYAGEGLALRMKGDDAVLTRDGVAYACRFDGGD